MTQIQILISIYVVMFFIPLIGGMISYRKNKNIPIYINQSKIKEPRFFAESFEKMFLEKWSKYDGTNQIILSKSENLIMADEIEDFPKECESIVVAETKDFIPKDVTNFKKEIMAMKNAYIYGDIQLRAIKGLKDIIIGQGISILRWVDAEGNLIIRDHCNLGLSASSATFMNVGKNVSFMRLFAPVIYLGRTQVKLYNHSGYIYSLLPSKEVHRNIETVSDKDINDSRIAEFSIVSNNDVKILERIILQGHINSRKGIRLYDNTFICGNLFAEEDIYIGKNVIVLGNIFSRGNIYVENDVVIGQEHHINSIVAGGTINFGLNTIVYGHVHCEKGGMVFKENLSQVEINQSKADEVRVYGIPENDKFRHLSHTKEEFDYEHPVSFRHDLNLIELDIPDGVEFIRSSMFFGCTNLERISIPASVKSIEEFAFYGCEKLKEIKIAEKNSIVKIGKSAFEKCTSLSKFSFPSLVETIESSAFSNCLSLCEISFKSDSALIKIDEHAFKDCVSLEQFICPTHVETIGLSAFYGCEKLLHIELPNSLKLIGDYAFFNCDALRIENFDQNTTRLLKDIKGVPNWVETQFIL